MNMNTGLLKLTNRNVLLIVFNATHSEDSQGVSEQEGMKEYLLLRSYPSKIFLHTNQETMFLQKQ